GSASAGSAHRVVGHPYGRAGGRVGVLARVTRYGWVRLAAKKKNARRPSPGVFYWGRVGAEWNVERPPALAQRVCGQGGIRGRAGSSPTWVLTSSAGRYRRGFRQSFVVPLPLFAETNAAGGAACA